MAAEEKWRIKYYALLDNSEQEQSQWQAIEQILRRIASRLSIAASAADSELNACLTSVTRALRQPLTEPELDALLHDLTTSIEESDKKRAEQQSVLEEHVSTSISKTRVRQLVIELVERLSAIPEAQKDLEFLAERISPAPSEIELAQTIERIADIINQHIADIYREKNEAERLLQQVTTRLDEIASYINGEAVQQLEARRNSVELDSKMQIEVKDLRDSARKAKQLSDLQKHVETSFQEISGHLKEFRSREELRIQAYKQRTEEMTQRVRALEKQTRGLHKSLQEEQRISMTDTVTCIPNRLAYDERIALEVKRWKRFSRPITICAWDIDHFKSINDEYGHLVGDKILRGVAQRMLSKVRQTDFVARYGGEEFVVILVGATPTESLSIAEEIRLEIELAEFNLTQKPLAVTISCGMTALREQDSVETVFDRADKALYRAKANGRNRCVVA